jgi:hypothetical protein
VRAPDVRDIRRGPAPQFGMDIVEAWRAVCCLHGDDVAEPGGLDAEGTADAGAGPTGGDGVTDYPVPGEAAMSGSVTGGDRR